MRTLPSYSARSSLIHSPGFCAISRERRAWKRSVLLHVELLPPLCWPDPAFIHSTQAVAWCPWQSNILATGGGTSDRHIRIWNVCSGACLSAVDVQSQVVLLWLLLVVIHGLTYPRQKCVPLSDISEQPLLLQLSTWSFLDSDSAIPIS